jgi:uncharacterized protein (TIGR01568 family)
MGGESRGDSKLLAQRVDLLAKSTRTVAFHEEPISSSSGTASIGATKLCEDGDEDGGVVLVRYSYSADAYKDFKESMMSLLQKHKVEEGRDREEQVDELLRSYLVLNPPEFHDLLCEVIAHIKSELGITGSPTQ